MVESQRIQLGISYLRFSWPTSKSGNLCSSSTCSPSRSPTSPSTGRPLTMRWRTNIPIFSFTYFTWKVQKRHWRGTTTRRSWSCSVIIDSMGHSWSPWIKTKPPMNWSVSRWPTYSLSRRWTAIFKTRASRMILYQNACYSSLVSIRNWMKYTRAKSATSSLCSSTKQVGVQQKRIAMIPRVAYTRITRAISADRQTCSSMRLRTARPSRTVRGGNTARVALNATNATRQSRGCTILTSISGSNAIGCVVTRWTSVPSTTIQEKRVLRTSSASST